MEASARMLRNAAISRQLAAESMVLLKNIHNTLPLLGSAEEPVPVAVFGVGQIYTVKGGTGSGNVNNLKTIPLLEGLENAMTLKPDALLAKKYRTWGLGHENLCVEGFMEPKGYYNEEMPLTDTEVASFAAVNDAAIMVITRAAGEGADMRPEKGMIYLTDGEKALMDQLTAHFEKTVLLLNTAGYMELEDYAQKFTAIVFMGLPGQDAGAVADVLTGNVMPSGHLTDTWPLTYTQYPTAGKFAASLGNGRWNESMGQRQEQISVPYFDDIYVGYRYFDTFGQEVRYPFGYGLGYGKTELAGYSLAVTGTKVSLDVTVENTGEVYPARQVVQCYVSCPDGKLEQPYQVLAAFEKTPLLNPGEEVSLTLTFDLRDLASFDEETCAYILEQGHYYIRIGDSSRSTAVCGAVFLPQTVTTKVLSDCLGHAEGLEKLSKAGISPITYPGEQEELAFAKQHAIRLSPREIQPTVQKYRKEPEVLRTGRSGLRLRDVQNGVCSLSEFVASMNTYDLCKLVCGIGMDLSGMPPMAFEDPNFNPPFNGILGGGGMKTPGAAGETHDLFEEYGIPPITLADGPAGIRITQQVKDDEGQVIRQQLCTAFPVGSLLSCSWDKDLLYRFGSAVAEEMLEYGVELWLAPGMNIHRDPLCGRNFEYYSEDPLVSGFSATHITKGVQSHGVGVTIKHFAGNNQETQRTNSNDIVSQRAFRDIYLRNFEKVVREAQPFAIMTSYNDINGVPAADNYDLCTAVCRDEWGFRGLIMTDWGGGISTPALSMVAGNDMLQPGGQSVWDEIANALAEGKEITSHGAAEKTATMTVAHLQRSVVHILSVMLRCRSVQKILKNDI